MDRKLNKSQKKVIEATESKVLVRAAAASGKTMCLTERIRYLLYNGVKPSEIVAITFTNNAASEMYERLGSPEGLFIGTVHSYCNFLLRAGGVSTTKILDDEKFDELFVLIKKNPQCIRHITHLIVDEAMDSTSQQFEFFELLNPDNYMYFYDHRQSIYGFASANPEYLIDLSHEPDVTVYEMNQNYRNGIDILRYARKILYPLGEEYEDDSIPMRVRNGEVRECHLTMEGTSSLIKRDGQWGDWFVLCRTNEEIGKFCKVFERGGVPYDTFKQGDLSNAQIQKKMKENTVKVLTIHSAKGLEADKVVVYNPYIRQAEDRRVLYVAATRAKDKLFWVYPTKVPKKKKKEEPKKSKKVKIFEW